MLFYLFRDDSMIETDITANDGCPSSKWCRLFKYFDTTEGTHYVFFKFLMRFIGIKRYWSFAYDMNDIIQITSQKTLVLTNL